MKNIATILLLSFFISTNAFSHGEDKYGPNQGYIKMPGTFHTELVPNSDGSFRVYLLDLFNKNATVKNSSIDFKMKDGTKNISFACRIENNLNYLCSTSENKLSKGQIVVTAKRLGIQAKPAIYDLPLKLKNEKEVMEGHDMSKMK